MEAMVQEWTDGRLDDLSSKVDQRFDRVEAEVQALRLEMRTEFTAVQAETNDLRGDIKAMGRELTGRLDSVQRTMVQMMVALTAAILAGFAGIFALLTAAL
jgi:predicted phage gp36 major capsid-like protein